MTLLFATILFILGTAIGSFLSVVIHRLKKKKEKIMIARSICPSCKKKLKFYHLIPVFSWIFLRGKCAFCGKRISFHYLLLEVCTGTLFLALFFKFNFVETINSTVIPSMLNYIINWQTVILFSFYALISTFFILIFFYDLKHQEIPDRLSIPAIAIAIAGGIAFKTISPLSMLIGGGAIGGFFLLQFVLSKGTWVGGGDIRLGALIGILLGWRLGLVALGSAYILGALVSIPLLIQKKVNRKSQIPFGPFLVTGALLALFFGEQILSYYQMSLLFY